MLLLLELTGDRGLAKLPEDTVWNKRARKDKWGEQRESEKKRAHEKCIREKNKVSRQSEMAIFPFRGNCLETCGKLWSSSWCSGNLEETPKQPEFSKSCAYKNGGPQFSIPCSCRLFFFISRVWHLGGIPTVFHGIERLLLIPSMID